MSLSKDNFLDGKTLLFNKPLGWSSFDVVKKVKYHICKKYNIKNLKVGHAGTLDPLASGLLIICTGKSTKIISEIQKQKKTYTGTITLGGSTASFDLETEIDKKFSTSHINNDLVYKIKNKFIGEIDQKPPVFSALKIAGERLYKKARRGEKVMIKSRKVSVYKFDILSFKDLNIDFEIECSTGTYIRSIANDFGNALNCGGHLSKLCRTAIGDYQLSKSIEILNFEDILNK